MQGNGHRASLGKMGRNSYIIHSVLCSKVLCHWGPAPPIHTKALGQWICVSLWMGCRIILFSITKLCRLPSVMPRCLVLSLCTLTIIKFIYMVASITTYHQMLYKQSPMSATPLSCSCLYKHLPKYTSNSASLTLNASRFQSSTLEPKTPPSIHWRKSQS